MTKVEKINSSTSCERVAMGKVEGRRFREEEQEKMGCKINRGGEEGRISTSISSTVAK